MTNFFGKKSTKHVRKTYLSAASRVDHSGASRLTLGSMTSFGFLNDPKHLAFKISRQKFVGKMLDNFERVLEVGCQDGFTSIIVAAHVGKLTAIDFYRPHIKEAKELVKPFVGNIEFLGHDILDSPVGKGGEFDAAFSLDVLEHIDKTQEDLYMRNIAGSIREDGVFIVGIPSIESQQYASPGSKLGHINCKSGEALHKFCSQYYKNVFMFGMNDEVLHTGFFPMCQYLFGLCVSKRHHL